MSFTGHEDHAISIANASELTRNFRDTNPEEVLGGFFSRDAIEAILGQDNCVGIRYYNAKNENGNHTIVLVGCDSAQNDLLPGLVKEFAKPNPPFLGNTNALNA